MDNNYDQLIEESFERDEGNPLPTHKYDLWSRQFDSIDFSKVIQAINTKERESKEEALTTIDLQQSKLGDQGVKHLSLLNTPNLIRLWLGGNKITAVGCSSLFPGKWSRNIRALDLHHNTISDKGCLYLSEGEFENLKELHLNICEIGNEGCLYLGKLEARQMEVISIQRNNIGDRGCKGLSRGNWPSLLTICLGDNQLEEKGVAHLSKAEWGELKQVKINGTMGGDRGCVRLGRARMKKLTRLQLRESGIREKGCQRLSKLNSEKVELIDVSNLCQPGKNRVGAWGKRCLEAKAKKIFVDFKQLE